MTFPVKICLGEHQTEVLVHALPRHGDQVACSFPTAGAQQWLCVVSAVRFVQAKGSNGTDPLEVLVGVKPLPVLRRRDDSDLPDFQ